MVKWFFRESFLNVKWAKRWLPTVFLLLSLFLPWWAFVGVRYSGILGYTKTEFELSFPWTYNVFFRHDQNRSVLYEQMYIPVDRIPIFLFISVLIVIAGLCGFGKNRVRTLGGLLGIAGIVSYSLLIFPISVLYGVKWSPSLGEFPYFGTYFHESQNLTINSVTRQVWGLSPGFYLALAGSLMLLSPLIRTLIERIKKRIRSSKQTIKEPSLIDVK